MYRGVEYKDLYPGIDLIFYGRDGRLEYDFALSSGANPDQIELLFEGAAALRLDGADLVIDTSAGEFRQPPPYAYQTVDGRRSEVQSRYVIRKDNRVGFLMGGYDRNLPLIIDPVLKFATFLGGSGLDGVSAIATDTAGNTYVTGSTSSPDFFTTAGSYQQGRSQDSADAFVVKYDPTGALIYSTLITGLGATAIAVDPAGGVYLAGNATSQFPVTAGPYRTTPDTSAVLKLNAAGSAIVYGTYFPGVLQSIAVDQAGTAFLSGFVYPAANFPTTAGAIHPVFLGGGSDLFVGRLNSSGTNLLYGPSSEVRVLTPRLKSLWTPRASSMSREPLKTAVPDAMAKPT